MQQSPERHVYFAVVGFGEDPSVVSRAMGVAPTKAWAIREPIGSGGGIDTHSRWVLQSTLPLAAPIEDHLHNLLAQLESRREAVAEVRDRFEARVSVAAYWYDVNPGFCLSASVVRRVAALGLEMDFDFYHLWTAEEPN